MHAQVLDSTLATYGNSYQPERTYLHYDKSAYAPGETIWFKAYIMEGMSAAAESKTFYVDWVDDKGNLLYHTSSPIVSGGITHGQFDVPETYKGSFIHVRAYTKWMLNFDTSFLYRKNIRIIQKENAPSILPAISASLQFFPEGGDMIDGIRNKIAFKAQDQWGRPVAVKAVVQKNGTTIDSLKFIHDGMGFFYLIPEEGAQYTARWTDTKNIEHITDLPPMKHEGISLEISFAGDKRAFTINRSQSVPDYQKTLHLVGTMQHTLVLKANVNLKESTSNSGVLPVGNLPSGVLTLTVFDDRGNAIAERVIHVNNGEYFFPIQSAVQKTGLSKRGKNEIELTVPEGVEANLSISVTDGSIERDSSDHIVSRFLLTSELRGSIYNPSYYFQNNSDSLAQKLDLVMLTNGWRRFKWEEVTKGKFPVIPYPKDTSYLVLSGKLLGATTAQLQNAGSLMMMIREKKDWVTKPLFANIQKDGSFRSGDYIFFDSLKVYYQLPKTLAKAKIDFMSARLKAFNYEYKGFAGSPVLFDTGYIQYDRLSQEVAAIRDKEILEGVTVTARRKTRLDSLDEKYTGGLFAGGDARQFDVMNDPLGYTYPDAIHYLQGRVAGLQIRTDIIDPISLLPKPYEMIWRGGSPIVYINERPANSEEVASLPVQTIAYIKVFRPPFMGSRGAAGDPANGAIAIYTKRGGDGFEDYKEPELPSSIVFGYSPVRQFYSPDYASTVSDNEKKDLRTTLLWKPNVSTGKEVNKVLLSFYNSDVYSKSLRVIVEGMTKDGRLTHDEQEIK
jgi:hypothetical protein